ncbi:hypothetical protein [Sphingomonas sp. Leaf38]|uniref:hypothetical protein n=1 Tax=Sphingomonas sp. Leaf38 TaxID=1736217 RepID=UPI000A81B6FB|nr:hypothetical protein [Sphingomonas sp. Leaf38]
MAADIINFGRGEPIEERDAASSLAARRLPLAKRDRCLFRRYCNTTLPIVLNRPGFV